MNRLLIKSRIIRVTIVPALIWGLSGCSTTTPVPRNGHFSISEKAEVRTRTGQNLVVSQAIKSGDSLMLFDSYGASKGSLPLHSVKDVVIVRRGRGAARGFLLGPLIGAGIGVILGLTPAGDCGEDAAGACIFGGPIASGFLFGLTGLIYGPVIGMIHGQREVYIFLPEAAKEPAPERHL